MYCFITDEPAFRVLSMFARDCRMAEPSGIYQTT